jgi:ribosomal protein S18 acetylase RimI-like enzyme
MVLRRQFSGEADLAVMQSMVAERTRHMGPCTNLHPGDIAHRIYSGLRRQKLIDVVPVYVDESGMIGFGIIWPEDQAFDVVTRTGLGAQLVTDVVEDLAVLAGNETTVETDVIGDDPYLTAQLTALGFTRGASEYVFTQASLAELVRTESTGFAIRSATYADAEQLALVHSGAFGSGWSPANYEERMHKPGYDPDNEIVAVHADGTFMGFTVTWYDEMNKVGYFEPVGVHRKFHRRGVGSALLRAGKKRMQRLGMETATVWHAAAEDRAVAFYESNGFTMVNPVTRWVRP